MKPFQGCITNWNKEYIGEDFIVNGHFDIHRNQFWQNNPGHTSRVLNIKEIEENMYLCETKNSFYILVGKERNLDARILLIDDMRNFHVDKVARTYNEGIAALMEETWDEVLLDHDLGEEKSGYDILCWIEEHQEYLPKKITLVTVNPVGRERMNLVLKNLYGERK